MPVLAVGVMCILLVKLIRGVWKGGQGELVRIDSRRSDQVNDVIPNGEQNTE